ncbi:hypothetical protein COLO4_21803 [Corchorus olitorius]|uniref:Uncharacterized protein n=1 Tax=Corchorus olitorius TaxID=93759 RepID=A0A1R3IQL7_9ROSI|nr:hypothetical protein COLO4_21803 [Corchorus olitorius]
MNERGRQFGTQQKISNKCEYIVSKRIQSQWWPCWRWGEQVKAVCPLWLIPLLPCTFLNSRARGC